MCVYAEEVEKASHGGKNLRKKAEELTVDEFLDGGFDELGASDSDDDGEAGSDEDDDDGLDDVEDSEEEEEEGSEDEEEDGSDMEEVEEEEPLDDEVAAGDSRELAAVKVANGKLRSEVKKHKIDLEALRAKDPDFYEYLKETDQELLNFDADESESEEEEEEEEEGGDEGEGKKKMSKKSAAVQNEEEEEAVAAADAGKKLITSERVKTMCKAAEGGRSLGAARFLLQAYRAACHYGDLDLSLIHI